MSSDWQEQFEAAWALREDDIYPGLFGEDDGGIYPLSDATFAVFNKGPADPRWLTHGVFKFPPTANRKSWLYVTSGLSNAWHDDTFDPDGQSGLGCELVFETPADVGWALTLVRRLLAYQILLGWNHYEGRDIIRIGDRIPLRQPIDGAASQLDWVVVAPPKGYAPRFQLPTGHTEFLHLVGLTEAEKLFAADAGIEALLDKLPAQAYPVTDPDRASVI